MTTISVVIPYFQKAPGILRRALASVLAQDIPPGIDVEVIVVDDGSPAPSESEISGLSFELPFKLVLKRQSNAGVAAARNTGLDSVRDDTTYIAFLDSDDIWETSHLRDAIAALDLGYNYYFCDNRRTGAHGSYFAQTRFDRYLTEAGTALNVDHCYAIDPATFFSFSLRAWTSLMPTVVYRRSIAPGFRFDPSLKAAGEDCVFLLNLISRSVRVCSSTKVNVTCSDGVNIFYSHYDWDAPGHLVRQMGQLLKTYQYLETLPLSPDDRLYVQSCIRQERRDFAFFSIRSMLKRRSRWPEQLTSMIEQDPDFWQWYIRDVIYVSILFPLRMYVPNGN
jgi:succinoglycan biosynthesis protein ExoW